MVAVQQSAKNFRITGENFKKTSMNQWYVHSLTNYIFDHFVNLASRIAFKVSDKHTRVVD